MLYEGRQHRRTSRESLDCALALQELEQMGVSNIITFDAHDPRVQNAVPLIGFDSVKPSYQILKALFRRECDLQIDRDHMMIVSPDEGAIDRNIFYSSVLGIDMGLFYKRRDYTTVVDGRNPIIAHEYLGDDVEGKDVFVSDDILFLRRKHPGPGQRAQKAQGQPHLRRRDLRPCSPTGWRLSTAPTKREPSAASSPPT